MPVEAELVRKSVPASLAYRPDIDGLRGVAVLAVVGYHAFPNWVPGGFIGVDVFFVISGFLISSLIFAGMAKGSFSLMDFYARRIRRIFPALLLVLSCCFAFGWMALLADEYAALSKHIAGGAGFLSNFVLLQESGYFDYGAELKPLLHLWSLGIEEQFYIVWPLLLAAFWRHKFAVPVACAGLVVTSFVLNLYWLPKDPVGTFYLPWMRCWELLAGAMLAWLQFHSPNSVRVAPGTLAVSCVVGCVFVLVAIVSFDRHSPFPGTRALLPVLGTCAVIASGMGIWVNRRLLAHPLLVWFGLISFPLYLWHWPLLSFAHIEEVSPLSRSLRIVAVVAAIGLAWGTYKFVEMPLRFGSHRKLKAAGLLVGMSIIGSVSYFTYTIGGVPSRLPPNMRVEMSPSSSPCGREYPRDSVCWGAAGGRKIMLLIGDSHGAALAPGIASELGRSSSEIGLVSVTTGGCMPLANVRSYDATGKLRDCEAMFREAFEFARDSDSVTGVVLVGRWASRVGNAVGFKEKEGDEARGSYEFIRQSPSAPDNTEAFRQGLDGSLSMIATKPVVFVHQVPELGLEPGKCAARPLRTSDPGSTAACAVALEEVVRRQAEYRKIAEVVLHKYPEVRLTDPVEVMCDDSKCSATQGGSVLYRDDDHLNGNGAAKVARELLSDLK